MHSPAGFDYMCLLGLLHLRALFLQRLLGRVLVGFSRLLLARLDSTGGEYIFRSGPNAPSAPQIFPRSDMDWTTI